MDFKLVTDKVEWNNFVAGQSHAQFLQSWEWGDFQKAYGRRLWRVGMFEDPPAGGKKSLVGVAQIIENYLGLGMGYLYCPRGPIFESRIMNHELRIKELKEYIKKEIANDGDIFVRIEPSLGFKVEGSELKVERVASIQPSQTLLIDLSESEEEILIKMHHKTRYNIRLAKKKNLEFRICLPASATCPQCLHGRQGLWQAGNFEPGKRVSFENFWKLLAETAKRDKIKPHPKKYYELMTKILSNAGDDLKYSIFNIFRRFDRDPDFTSGQYSNFWLCAGLFIGFGDTFAYVHGASANENREMMAPYLLQWEAIKFAKQKGYKYYDFGGLNPDDSNNPDFRISWKGITRFKEGFGGDKFGYAGTFEIPLKEKSFKLFKLAKKIRKII